MEDRIKIFCFKGDEYAPDNNGLYIYKNVKYTNRTFINYLKSSLVWFNSYFKEVLK